VLRTVASYRGCVLNRQRKKNMTNSRYTSLREIELAAHRARNREMARLLRLAGSAIAGLGRRLASGLGPKRIHHA
jgi:hypothetical protein